MGFNETAALIDTAFALGFALVFALVAFLVFRSNSRNAKAWKLIIASLSAFLVLSGLGGAISPTRAFLRERSARLDYEASVQALGSLTVTTSSTSTATTTTTTTTTTTQPSTWGTPTPSGLSRWAEDAVEYAEAQDWRFGDRDEAMISTMRLARKACLDLRRFSSTPDQIEAEMRMALGMEGWVSFGETWYDSLVNGLCIRK